MTATAILLPDLPITEYGADPRIARRLREISREFRSATEK